MSAERKKLLWISISACVFVLIILAAGFILLAPKKNGALAPATISNTAAPKAQDPQDFLSAPPPAPALEQPHNQDGGVIIVYGDKPASTATGTSATTPATGGATVTGAAGTAAPAASSASGKAAATAPAPAKAAPAVKIAPAVKKPIPTTIKADEYWIQAASFTSRGRADELKQGLAEKGIAALISVKDISGKSWYRVRIGPYSVKADAEGWLGRLKGLPSCAEAYVSRMTATKTGK